MAEVANGVHAVVWGAGDASRDLVGALARQGITWEEAAGPFDALSRVLALRGASSRSRVLLLVEPESLAGAPEVRAALDRFDPATACWGYCAARSPRLAPLLPPAPPAEPEIVVKRVAGARAGPDLRLAGDRGSEVGAGAAGPGREDEDEPPSPRSLLTAEELAMLLADDLE